MSVLTSGFAFHSGEWSSPQWTCVVSLIDLVFVVGFGQRLSYLFQPQESVDEQDVAEVQRLRMDSPRRRDPFRRS